MPCKKISKICISLFPPFVIPITGLPSICVSINKRRKKGYLLYPSHFASLQCFELLHVSEVFSGVVVTHPKSKGEDEMS